MKKLIFFLILLTAVVGGIKAQIVVSGEMFIANPNMFMGKVVVIKDPTFKSRVSQPGAPTPAVVGVVASPAGSSAGAPTGVSLAGPKSGNTCCNPRPNLQLTKWEIAPGKVICVQVDQRNLPMLPGGVQTCKEISFRVTPEMYVLTRCVVK